MRGSTIANHMSSGGNLTVICLLQRHLMAVHEFEASVAALVFQRQWASCLCG
jgi:hypothetical protein